MSIPEGTHNIGPSNGSLKVKTGKEGAAAKMGHDLVITVNSWDATIEGGDSPSIKLTADPSSLEVAEGSGGAKPLSDKDKGDIKKSIDKKVLGSSQISFTSSEVTDSAAKGDLSIAGKSSSVNVPLKRQRQHDQRQHHAQPERVRDQAVLGDDGRPEGQGPGHRRVRGHALANAGRRVAAAS